MKKIAYIELETHSEILNMFRQLMEGNNLFEVDYLVSNKIESSMPYCENRIITVEPNTVIRKLQEKQYDLIIIGTAQRYFNIFRHICEKYNSAIIVHNINFSRSSTLSLIRNIWRDHFKYRVKLICKEDLLSASKVYQLANYLLVLGENMVETPFIHLPLYFNEKQNYNHNNEPVRIVIPGTVSQKKRDYLYVLNKISTFKIRLKLTFLGKACDRELKWIKDCERNLPSHITFKYFEQRVTNTIFNDEMLNADLLWCPLQPSTDCFGCPEIYGETKVSGNIGDAIKYGKKAIFPAFYKTDYPFIFAEEQDIERQIAQVLSYKYDFQEHMNKNAIQEKFIKVMLKLVK